MFHCYVSIPRGCSSGWQLAHSRSAASTVAASAPLRRSPSSTAISSTGLPSTQARRSRGSSSPACALLTPTAAPRGARSVSFATSGPSSGTPHSVLRTQTSPTPPSSVALGPRLMASPLDLQYSTVAVLLQAVFPRADCKECFNVEYHSGRLTVLVRYHQVPVYHPPM